MNRAQKEAYKRDYAASKKEGKSFFPHAIYKDHIVGVLVIGIVIALAIAVRVKVGEPINPATTTYVPRPEWYFFFLFELLRIFKNQNAVMPLIMATFLVPNVLMALLVATPFIDRGPERRIHKRPFAIATAGLVIFFLCYLTYLGANAPEGLPSGGIPLSIPASDTQATAGLKLFETKGCTGCHTIKGAGGAVGPNLTNEGTKTAHDVTWHINHLKNPRSETPGSQMPAFASFSPQEYQDLAALLTGLGTKYK